MSPRREDDKVGAVRMEPGADPPFHVQAGRIVNPHFLSASVSGCGITLVEVQWGSNVQPIWQNGSPVSPLPQIGVGQSWEIHATYNILSDSACKYAITCMVNNVSANPGIHAEAVSSSIYQYTQRWDFNAPAVMTVAGAAVRVKFWYIADQYAANPPQSEW